MGNGLALAILLGALVSSLATAQAPANAELADAAPGSVVQLRGLTLTPAAPGPDTLCKLRVTVRNDGKETVSALRFDVTVGGTSLAVYERQVFMDTVAPGAEAEVELFNFWTTETHRPAPKDGKLTVTVALSEARSTAIVTEDDGSETWTVGEPITPLPSPVSTTVALTTPKG